MLRALGFTVLFAAAAVFPPAVASDATVPTVAPAPADRLAALTELAALAVACGLPDARGATLYHGSIGSVMRYGEHESVNQIAGLHAKLADGRWLIGLQEVMAAADVRIDEGALHTIEPAALVEAAGAYADGWKPEALEQILPMVRAADRDQVRSAASAFPVVIATSHGGNHPVLLVVNLVRLGAPCADEVAVITPLSQMWNPFATSILGPPAPLRLGGQPDFDGAEMQAAPHDIVVPDPVVAVRAGLITYFRERALGGGRGQMSFRATPPPDPAAAQAAAQEAMAAVERLLPPGENEARADLALLRGRAALPATVADDASLAERLAVWDGGLAVAGAEGRDEGPDISGFGRMNWGAITNGDTTLTATEADLDPLFALLGDPRPCRWLDGGRARTLGDNALRAIGAIYGCDPRILIARDPAAPWTDAERAATAAALRAWRSANAARPLDEVLIAAVPKLTPADLVRVIQQRPATSRGPLLDAATKAWAHQPVGVDENTLAAMITAAGEHAGMLAAISSWKVEGELAPMLAAFHLTRGDQAPFDAQLAAALASNGDESALTQLVPIMRFAPSPARLQQVVEVLRAPADAKPTAELIQLVCSGMNWGGNPTQLAETWAKAQAKGDEAAAKRRSQTVPLALYALLLADQRPLTEALREQAKETQEQGKQMHASQATPAAAPPALAADLRLADLAGAGFSMLAWQMDELLGDDLRQRAQTLAIDLAAPIADRDRQLTELRRLVGERLGPALEAAGLPNLTPAGGPAAGDAKSLF